MNLKSLRSYFRKPAGDKAQLLAQPLKEAKQWFSKRLGRDVKPQQVDNELN